MLASSANALALHHTPDAAAFTASFPPPVVEPTTAISTRTTVPGVTIPTTASHPGWAVETFIAAESGMLTARQVARTALNEHTAPVAPTIPAIPDGNFLPDPHSNSCTVCGLHRYGSSDDKVCPRLSGGDRRAGISACIAASKEFREYEAALFAMMRKCR